MKPAPFSQKDHDKDKAKADCIKYGTPTMGVDHSSHYKPIAGGKTFAEYTEATRKAFNIPNGGCHEK